MDESKLQGYVRGGGPFPTRWIWFVAEPGLTDEDFDRLYRSDVEAFGFALTRAGAERKATRWVDRAVRDGALTLHPVARPGE